MFYLMMHFFFFLMVILYWIGAEDAREIGGGGCEGAMVCPPFLCKTISKTHTYTH